MKVDSASKVALYRHKNQTDDSGDLKGVWWKCQCRLPTYVPLASCGMPWLSKLMFGSNASQTRLTAVCLPSHFSTPGIDAHFRPIHE